MKLQNSLYTIAAPLLVPPRGEDGCSYTISLNPEHQIYKVHFPGLPITPGVCIVQIAVELLELCTGRQLQIDVLKNVKFLNVISPNEVQHLTYELKKVNTEGLLTTAQVTVKTDSTVYSKISIVCKQK